jgi:hypothetical protein
MTITTSSPRSTLADETLQLRATHAQWEARVDELRNQATRYGIPAGEYLPLTQAQRALNQTAALLRCNAFHHEQAEPPAATDSQAATKEQEGSAASRRRARRRNSRQQQTRHTASTGLRSATA